VEILISYKNAQWYRMGLFLALALIKPNVMLLPVLALGLWLLRSKVWKPVVVAGILLVVLVLITTALTPDWYQVFSRPNFGQGLTEVLDGPEQVTGVRLNTTLLDWLKWFSIPATVRNVIYGLTVSVCLWILGKRISGSKSILDVTVTALLVSFAITPYALQYDFPPLAITLCAALASGSQIRSKWIPTLVVLFITSVLFWERPISDGYWIVIGLCILTIWVTNSANSASQSLDTKVNA
jgi:hypothetical protein